MSTRAPVGLRTGISVAIAAIIAMSAAINLLTLGGAIYMLQVYERVLSSQSVPTLVVLTILLATAYVGLALLDALRAQLMSRVAARIDAYMATRAFEAMLATWPSAGRRTADNQSIRDLEGVRAFLLSPAPVALMDLPWAPLFLIFVVALDPTLGWVTLAALVIMIIVAQLAQRATNHFETASAEALRHRRMLADAAAGNADILRAMGLGMVLSEQRQQGDVSISRSMQRACDRMTWLNSLAKIFRLSVHSALIGVGAYVALKGDLTLGAIVAATIAAGRALAQVELATAYGQSSMKAWAAWRRLRALASMQAPSPPPIASTDCALSLQGVSYIIPGQPQPVLRGINLYLKPGEALAVLGKSGAGKTLLAETILGLCTPTIGSVLVAGVPMNQLVQSERRPRIGYAPQREQWLPGDIADTITKFAARDMRGGAVETAKAIGLHRSILDLPHGYSTPIEVALALLSQGQRRLLALARAFHDKPLLIVLDDPFGDLDADGEIVLNRMISEARRRGAIVVVTSKRRLARSAIERVFLIDGGMLRPAIVTPPAGRQSPDVEKRDDQTASIVELPRRIS